MAQIPDTGKGMALAAFDAWVASKGFMVVLAPANCTTLAIFTQWLADRQQCAVQGMQSNTGDIFAKHCDDFTDVTTALRVVMQYQGVVSEVGL